MKPLRTLLLSALLFIVAAAQAVPADPTPTVVLQPDGTSLTIMLQGDEFFALTTTADGYTLLKRHDGFYVYAERQTDGTLAESAFVAHNADERSPEEAAFLALQGKGVASSSARAAAKEQRRLASVQSDGLVRKPKAYYNYSNFRGLVILVEYNDCKFSRSDAAQLFGDMVSKKDYQGIMSADGTTLEAAYTGSVRDYFYDNSLGRFDPQFDVVGPVTVDVSQYYAKSTTNGVTLAKKAVEAADSLVDFSLYDRDGDGIVEMLYIIYAGHGANIVGNNSNLLWPHTSNLGYRIKDGVKLYRYACSTEFTGKEGTAIIDGIGTICHEFSHVLGLRDEYDVDYEKSGGQSIHPASWSIMASGSYNNYSRTPAGFTLSQRYQAGFSTPTLITTPGAYTVPSLEDTGTGYRINSAVDNEFFLLENRRKTKWDLYLPAEGLLVFRVDSTKVSAWNTNTVNSNPTHNYLELIRAVPATEAVAAATDVFPQDTVTRLTNLTTPSLRSWDGTATPLVIENIAQNDDGTIAIDINTHENDLTPIASATTDDDSSDDETVETILYDISGRRIRQLSDGQAALRIRVLRSGAVVREKVMR